MKTLRLTCAFFGFIVGVGVVIAQSNPPTPSSREASQPPKQVTQTDKNQPPILQKGTEDSPLVIRLKKTPTDEAEARRDAEKRDDDSTSVRWTMVFTGFQAVFALGQVILFCWQLGQIRNSLKHAKDAADAAKQTAEIMDSTAKHQLRAYIQVVPFEIFGTPTGVSNKTAPLRFKFRVSNFGQTPAKNVTFQGRFFVAQHPLPPDYPLPEPVGETVPPTTIFPTSALDDTRKPTVSLGRDGPLSIEEYTGIYKGEQSLYVLGRGSYTDVFDDLHRFEFCFALDCSGTEWMNGFGGPQNEAAPIRAIVAPRGNSYEPKGHA